MRVPEVQESLGRQGFDVVAGSPQEFSRWIRGGIGKIGQRSQNKWRDS
jgi:hypothetical protein